MESSATDTPDTAAGPVRRKRWRWVAAGCAVLVGVIAGVAGWPLLTGDDELPEFCHGVGIVSDSPSSAGPTAEAALRAHLDEDGETFDGWREHERGTFTEFYGKEMPHLGEEIVTFVNPGNVDRPQSRWQYDVYRRNGSWYVSGACESVDF